MCEIYNINNPWNNNVFKWAAYYSELYGLTYFQQCIQLIIGK